MENDHQATNATTTKLSTESFFNQNNLLYGMGAIGLGAVGIAFGDFALQWQPVPSTLPMRIVLAYASGATLVFAGCLALSRRAAPWGVLLLAIIYTVWTMVLHGPQVVAHPLDIVPWLAFCEIAALAAAGFALFATKIQWYGRAIPMVSARAVFGVCAIVFGLSHFKFPAFTASMVPHWIPAPLFWAYVTGAGHTAAGLGIVTGRRARLAATMLTLMMGSFVVLVHLPRVLSNLGSHAEWTMLAVAATLTGAAWGVSRTIVLSGSSTLA